MSIPADALFGRRWLVTITSDVDTKVAKYGNVSDAGTLLSSLVGAPGPSGLRVAFDITKSMLQSPNRGIINITNMSPDNRTKLRPGLNLKIEIGYQGPLQLLFAGTVAFVKHERQISDVVTGIEVMDGDAAISSIPFDKSYAANTPVATIIMDIVDLLRTPTPLTPKGIVTGPIGKLPTTIMAQGYTAHGSMRDNLSDLCYVAGLEWSIQDGAITICPLNESTGSSGQLISRATGMLGTPTFDGKVCTVSCLANPKLVPGQTVKVTSKDGIDGVFKIRGGRWVGDSHGDTWGCELECVPIGGGALANVAGNTVSKLISAAKSALK